MTYDLQLFIDMLTDILVVVVPIAIILELVKRLTNFFVRSVSGNTKINF